MHRALQAATAVAVVGQEYVASVQRGAPQAPPVVLRKLFTQLGRCDEGPPPLWPMRVNGRGARWPCRPALYLVPGPNGIRTCLAFKYMSAHIYFALRYHTYHKIWGTALPL